MAPGRTRSWWRSEFDDHPLCRDSEPPPREAYVRPDARNSKTRLYCKECLQETASRFLQLDEMREEAGQIEQARTLLQIKIFLFNLPSTLPYGEVTLDDNPPKRGWIESRTLTLLHHLRDCRYVNNSIKQQAIDELKLRHAKRVDDVERTPRAQRTHHTFRYAEPPPPPNFAAMPDYYAPIPSGTYSFPSSQPISIPILHPGPILRSGSVSRPPSPTPSSYSTTSTRSSSRVSIRSYGASDAHQYSSNLAWNEERQHSFERHIVRMTASCGFPLSWVDNPLVRNFFQEFIPHAKSPSRKVLSQRLLPAELDNIRSAAKRAAAGNEGTLQGDGWTGENNHHFLAFMVTVNEKLYTVELHDTTTERKTADNLRRKIEDTIQILKDEWNVSIVTVTTDSSGDGRKA
ncbi:hypothetical protein BDQ17DRAFT_1434471 [Cyathus striatus]|nr:hypothetical protein BDQ17DRAFT_1434471 [Cyathus striatus]